MFREQNIRHTPEGDLVVPYSSYAKRSTKTDNLLFSDIDLHNTQIQLHHTLRPALKRHVTVVCACNWIGLLDRTDVASATKRKVTGDCFLYA